MTSADGTQKAGVLIVDDHAFLRRGLVDIIEDLPETFVCGEAAGASEALDCIRARRPDVAVIDISLGDGNGIELTKEIKSQWPEIKVLISSMHDETLYAERALRAGALGYINKSDEVEQFIEALRRVMTGQIYLSTAMTNRVLSQVVSRQNETALPTMQKLSDRELEVFELIGNGIGTKEIATRLDLSRKTVETYREHIKSKLGLRNGTELTHHAVRWVLDQTPAV